MKPARKPRILKKYAPKYRKLSRTDDRIKALYEQRDKLESQLLEKVRTGDRIPLGNGRFAVLRDNFEGKNRAYRAHGISRFEFKIEVSDS